MKNAIILHGMPTKEEYEDPTAQHYRKHWMPWLKGQLESAGIPTEMPLFPEPYAPDYEKWLAVFEKLTVNENTLLIGHSCGGGFLVRWLSENPVRVSKVALVAPWIDPSHAYAPKMFNDLHIEPALLDRTEALRVFFSTDDDKEIYDSLEELKRALPGLDVQEFIDKGHFTRHDMKTEEFPELRDFLLS